MRVCDTVFCLFTIIQEDIEKVIADCTAALALNKRYVKAMMRRAKAAEKINDIDLALEDLATACILEGFHNTDNIQELDRIAKATGSIFQKMCSHLPRLACSL